MAAAGVTNLAISIAVVMMASKSAEPSITAFLLRNQPLQQACLSTYLQIYSYYATWCSMQLLSCTSVLSLLTVHGLSFHLCLCKGDAADMHHT